MYSTSFSSLREANEDDDYNDDDASSVGSTDSGSTTRDSGMMEMGQQEVHDVDLSQAGDDKRTESSVFHRARSLIKTGWLFRIVTWLYAERKLIITILFHFVCTMIVWSHFALIKFRQQEEKVPLGANRYWWKRIAPPLEFGSMHAILFQMALIPLTMSRLSISAASSSFLEKFIPFNRMVRFHIHLGYTMIFIVFFATIFFFIFFGILCADGEDAFCLKFTSEIMITGYVILSLLLLVGLTSFLRNRIPYEIFYAIHHLVFLMYGVATAHTFDNVQRSGRAERSQTFRWYSATLLFYLLDRAYMYINQRYKTSIVRSSAIKSRNGKRMAIIKLKRPVMFRFQPGQYAMLRITSIDMHWHAFSIASGPSSDYLEFYIEVCGNKSWTGALYDMINVQGESNKDNNNNNDSNNSNNKEQKNEDFVSMSPEKIMVEVKGPYGTSLGRTEKFSHGIAIGSGTGIVPILSLFKQHVRELLRLDPSTYMKELQQRQEKTQQLYATMHQNGGSVLDILLSKIYGGSFLRRRRRRRHRHKRHRQQVNVGVEGPSNPLDMSIHSKTLAQLGGGEGGRGRQSIMNRSEASIFVRGVDEIIAQSKKARARIFQTVTLMFLPTLGVLMLGLTISWNTTTVPLYGGMAEVLAAGTIFFQTMFFLVALCIHENTEFFTYVDIIICILSGLVDWYWFAKDLWGKYGHDDIVFYVMLMFYMTARSWHSSVRTQNRTYLSVPDENERIIKLQRLRFLWVTRSAPLVDEVLPEIIDLWNAVCDAWGTDLAEQVCDISIYITDRDEDACEALKFDHQHTSLYRRGSIQFRRPDLGNIIESHNIERINDTGSLHSNTLLAFCGSPKLSSYIHQQKIINDMSMYMTGNTQHRMEYVSESYGASRQKDSNSTTPISSSSHGISSPSSPSSPFLSSFRKSHRLGFENEDNDDDEADSIPGRSIAESYTSRRTIIFDDNNDDSIPLTASWI